MFLKLDHAYSLTVKKRFVLHSKRLNSESLFEIAHRIFSIPMKQLVVYSIYFLPYFPTHALFSFWKIFCQ